MSGLISRHWTTVLILLVLGGWAIFYLPDTPSYAILRLKQTIDARNGDAAATYVDFQKVVQAAGNEMVQGDTSGTDSGNEGGGNLLGQLLGKGMVELFSGPMAAMLQQWAVQRVNDGAQEVQMPAAGVAGAIVLLHRDGDAAYTRWTDHKGQTWEVRMAREDGQWKIVQVKNVRALLEKLKRHEEKDLNNPASPPPATEP
jgi:hypothetical protein